VDFNPETTLGGRSTISGHMNTTIVAQMPYPHKRESSTAKEEQRPSFPKRAPSINIESLVGAQEHRQ